MLVHVVANGEQMAAAVVEEAQFHLRTLAGNIG